ncbi:MAG TPA: aspartate kinase [Vicinamibacterales bacterium]|jgi:aspartate kinase
MRVLKFGGTSVADAAALERLVGIVKTRTGARTVVVSALAGVTDRLLAIGELAVHDRAGARAALDEILTRHLDMARALSALAVEPMLRGIARGAERTVDGIADAAHASPPLLDKLVAAGELWSSRLVAAYLTECGVRAQWIDARHLVSTDGRHRQATPDLAATEDAVRRHVRPALALDRVVVTGGFIGSGPGGVTTTLGRGGSDYSAAILGACLLADEIEIWTDVDGVYSADPRVVAGARVLPAMSYEDAEILATFGAKVLHPRTIEPAAALGIPVRVLNSRRPDAPGTRIDADGSRTGGYIAVAARGTVTLVHVTARQRRADRAFAARVLQAMADAHVAVLVGEVHKGKLTVAVSPGADLDGLRARVGDFAEVQTREGLTAVCAVGDRLTEDPRLVMLALAAFDGRHVHLVARPGGAASALAVVVEDAAVHDLLARLHGVLAGEADVLRAAVA